MNVNRGMVANSYSVTLSPMGTRRKLMARIGLPLTNQIATNDTVPSATGM